jgi:hypothetical protein
MHLYAWINILIYCLVYQIYYHKILQNLDNYKKYLLYGVYNIILSWLHFGEQFYVNSTTYFIFTDDFEGWEQWRDVLILLF